MTTEARLNKLEKSVRRWKQIGVSLMVLVTAAVFTGAGIAVQDTIRAKNIEIVNAKGKVAMRLTSDANGATIIGYDNAGNTALIIKDQVITFSDKNAINMDEYDFSQP